jgi:chromosome segregation ATPase
MNPNADANAVKPSEKTTQLVRKSSSGPPTQGQPQHPTSFLSDAYTAHDASPFQKATPEELGSPASAQIARERNLSLNGLPSQPTGVNGQPRRVPLEDDVGEGSDEYRTKFAVPDASSEGEVARLERERLVELERQLSAMRAAQTEKDAGLVNIQAKLDELLLSRDQHVRALEQAQSALQKATSRAADADDLSKRACEQIARYETGLAEVRAKVEARESELEVVRLRLRDVENGWARSRTEADTLRAMTTPGLVSTDEAYEDRITRRVVERMRVMEAELASLRLSEKSSEAMQSRNEE